MKTCPRAAVDAGEFLCFTEDKLLTGLCCASHLYLGCSAGHRSQVTEHRSQTPFHCDKIQLTREEADTVSPSASAELPRR